MSRKLDVVPVFAEDPAVALRLEALALGPDAVVDLDLSLPPGGWRAIVLPAGDAGRLIDILSFARLPARGRAVVLGRDVATVTPAERPGLRRRIGVVFGDHRLLADLTVFDNIALPARLAGRRLPHYRDEVDQLIDWADLGSRRDAPAADLSRAEGGRAALARALINRPDLLLVERPRAGLARRLAAVNAAGVAVLIATPDPAWASTEDRQ